jgi:membrane protein implicated in regulation of membrane protease activity
MDLTLVFFLLMLLFLLTELLFPVLIPISLAGGFFSTGIFYILELNTLWLILIFIFATVLTFQLGKVLSERSETMDEK